MHLQASDPPLATRLQSARFCTDETKTQRQQRRTTSRGWTSYPVRAAACRRGRGTDRQNVALGWDTAIFAG
jgi:hypothetical protein